MMDIPRLVEQARREPRVACAYAGLCVFICGVYWLLHMRGFELYEMGSTDHFLTWSAALQTVAFFLLGVKIKACDIEGISPNMFYAYVIAYATRIATTLTFAGYLPEDETQEVYLYQISECLGLAVVLYNICCVRRMRVQFAYASGFIEEVKSEGPPVLPTLCVVSLVLGAITRSDGHDHALGDTVWMFSQWMDTLAMAPQLWLVARQKTVERRTSHFIALMICARVMLGLFWLHVVVVADMGWCFTLGIIASNVIHLVLCADYMYYFILTIRQPSMVLPGMSV